MNETTSENSKNSEIKEINELGESLKKGLLKDSVFNSIILILVVVFFSILFDFTKKVIIGFVDLSWSDIFPILLDLMMLYVIGLTIRKTKNLIFNTKLVLKIEEEEKYTKEKVSFFLSNEKKNLNESILGFLIFSIIYFFGVELLDLMNHKFSILNNWYFENFYGSLPIYPLNMIILILIFSILLPINKSLFKYREKLSKYLSKTEEETFRRQNIDNVMFSNILGKLTLIGLCVFCIILSLAKQNNNWNFKYLASNEIPEIIISNGSYSIEDIRVEFLCKLKRNYEIKHKKIELSFSYYNNDGSSYNSSSKVSKNLLINEKTKDNLETYCKLNPSQQ